ncbi:unnamed protein product [Rotaria sp. Silwood2]|nr:unnamed protein product [Rotaria sp. Silwood2]CAF4115390.1 unnamed protein product [Rotaria sp. Silwood2]CAF4359153.1 unnamed protein product [Rotaria sp. Silwood2]CAF4360553.1 unnamed protein product [Rotaria sp. Silwood2]
MEKRQVEKDSLFRMFHLRTIEMRQNWITLGCLDYFKTTLENSSTNHALFSLLDSEQLDDELRNSLKVYRTVRQSTVVNIF